VALIRRELPSKRSTTTRSVTRTTAFTSSAARTSYIMWPMTDLSRRRGELGPRPPCLKLRAACTSARRRTRRAGRWQGLRRKSEEFLLAWRSNSSSPARTSLVDRVRETARILKSFKMIQVKTSRRRAMCRRPKRM